MTTLFILVVIALCLAGAVLVPVLSVGVVLMLLAPVFIWLLPIFLIAGSDRSSGMEKLCWILAIVFLSWFAWILYVLVAPVAPRREEPMHYY